MISVEQLGLIFRERRKLAGITQKDLADLSELAVHTLSDLESGKGNPTFDVISRVCKVLGLEIQVMPRQPNLSDSGETEGSGAGL